MTATVIVTDGNERAALAVVRSLGTAGYRCVVVADTVNSLAGASRFAATTVAVASALEAPGEFADQIAEVARAERAALLIPIAEPAILALLGQRERFEGCTIPFPDLETFRALSDKQRLLSRAPAHGIAVPAQVVASSHADANAIVPGLTYPVVLKPARSVGEAAGVRRKVGVVHANDPDEARRRIADLLPAAFPLLIQQRIEGPGTGVFILLWDGEVRASFAHRRLTEKPPTGGVSVDRESIPLDADLLARSRALLNAFGWCGVAMVEYKRDATTGQLYLMEINGRFWGSLQLAIDSGVDFPRLLAHNALGDRPVSGPDYRIGVRSRWFWGQVDHVFARLRRRNVVLPTGTISLPRAMADLLLGPFHARNREEVFRWTDPRPFIHESLQWLRRR